MSAEVNKFHSNIQQVISEQFSSNTTQVNTSICTMYLHTYVHGGIDWLCAEVVSLIMNKGGYFHLYGALRMFILAYICTC